MDAQRFPSECPYPPLAAAKYALSITSDAWETENDRSHRVDDGGSGTRVQKITKVIQDLAEEFSPKSVVVNESVDADALWMDHDEHFIQPDGPSLLHRIPDVLRLPCVLTVFMVGVLAAKMAANKDTKKQLAMQHHIQSGISAAGAYYV